MALCRSARKKVVVVLPAYNAEKTLEKTVADIPDGTADEIILVDDCSTDGRRLLMAVCQSGSTSPTAR
jgi:glycosyltransferase involved in cell wall biosynthesis